MVKAGHKEQMCGDWMTERAETGDREEEKEEVHFLLVGKLGTVDGWTQQVFGILLKDISFL